VVFVNNLSYTTRNPSVELFNHNRYYTFDPHIKCALSHSPSEDVLQVGQQ